jgi:hypothetical protein
MKDPVSPQLDRQCAAYAIRMNEEEGIGLILVQDGTIHDIRLELVEQHLEGDLKDLVETMIRRHDPETSYPLVVMTNGSLIYIGIRRL